MDNNSRKADHKRIKELESVLKLVNDSLEVAENSIEPLGCSPQKPPIFIVGNARSGTTLLYQWLASSGLFAYPSNIMSRFYKSPYLGSLIHKIMIDLDHKEELHVNTPVSYSSNLGKTKGPEAPHEFWYFWRRYFSFKEIQKLSPQQLEAINSYDFLKDLALIEQAFNKPLLMKAMILNWNLSFLAKILPKSIFLIMKRNSLDNMASLYNARISFFGTAQKWYSFKPPQYEELKQQDIYKQLAGQVLYTNNAIDDELKNVSTNRKLYINYEELCNNPENTFSSIMAKLGITQDYTGINGFQKSNKKNSNFDTNKAKEALLSLQTS